MLIVVFLWTLIYEAVLGSQQKWGESTESSHVPTAPPPDFHTINILCHCGTFVKVDQSLLTYHDHPKSRDT
jgi:hypothetical protein